MSLLLTLNIFHMFIFKAYIVSFEQVNSAWVTAILQCKAAKPIITRVTRDIKPTHR